jgi:hypothetical protein
MHARFLRADIFDRESVLKDLGGRIDIMIASHFFHLFTWEGQIQAVKNVVKLSRSGTQIIGYQIGRPDQLEGELLIGKSAMTGPNGQNPFLHSPESFKRMWSEAEKQTSTQWTVEASAQPLTEWDLEKEDFIWMGPHATGLEFVATRQA